MAAPDVNGCAVRRALGAENDVVGCQQRAVEAAEGVTPEFAVMGHTGGNQGVRQLQHQGARPG